MLVQQSRLPKAILEWAGERVPLARMLYEREYERRFAQIVPFARRFRGVYTTFSEAIAAAPQGKPVGYDNPKAATFMAPSGPLWLSDYPVLFWLEKALAECPTLLDVGGYVGISYYSFRRHLCYPHDLQWLIYDVPAVTEAGTEIAQREDSRGLAFTAQLDSGIQAHTVLACGSMQFIEQPFDELLLRLASLPRHLIINKTPLTDGLEFVTLQDLGPAVCPYRISNRTKFVESIEKLGYRLVDSWANVEFSCRIPFHSGRSVTSYTGLYFKATP
jgi:putative methyltransferase (TIGR04325 family)